MKRRTVLIFTDYYLPGFKAGGPIRSISNLVEHLSENFEFKIITKDRDSKDFEPYSDVKCNEWNDVGRAKVYYVSPENQNLKGILNILRNTSYDCIYLNSFFSYKFSLYPLIAERLFIKEKKDIILAPRGEFSEGALKIKNKKKKAFIKLFKFLNIQQEVIWHASTSHEEKDIKTIFNKAKIAKALNLPTRIDINNQDSVPIKKNKNILKIIFVSRITEKKNLIYALNLIRNTTKNIEFNIYGMISDQKYWEKCLSIINQMPKNVKVVFHGPIQNNQVVTKMAAHHMFLFPTYGENYGHVVMEALSSGCPVVISDRTPWNNLENKGVGYDIALEDEEKYKKVINEFYTMNNEEFQLKSSKTKKYALSILNDNNSLSDNKSLFEEPTLRNEDE